MPVLVLVSSVFCSADQCSSQNVGPVVTSASTAPIASYVPAPQPTTQEPAATLPEMSNLGNGGPLFGDAAAVARINAQFIHVPGDHVVSGSDALEYANLLARVTGLGDQFAVLDKEASCALNYGVLGAQAYVTPGLTEAGIVLVLSHMTLQSLPTIALKCIVKQELFGGPGSSSGPSHWDPCFESYEMTDSVDNVSDTYYVYNIGTNQAWCQLTHQFDASLSPLSPIRY